MAQVTKDTGSERKGWSITDPVIQLRVRGETGALELPASASTEPIIGAAPECELRIGGADDGVSRRHARLARLGSVWTIHDLDSTNGIFHDGERRLTFQLAPGVEIGIGGITLIAESERLIALRELLARAIGWGTKRRLEVDRALRAVRDMANARSALVLCGEGDLTSLVRRIHMLALGRDRPFVECHGEIEPMLGAAAGRLISVRGGDKLPPDIADLNDAASDLRVVVGCESLKEARAALALLPRAELVEFPSVASRAHEIDRLVNEYATDAVATLGASAPMFSRARDDLDPRDRAAEPRRDRDDRSADRRAAQLGRQRWGGEARHLSRRAVALGEPPQDTDVRNARAASKYVDCCASRADTLSRLRTKQATI